MTDDRPPSRRQVPPPGREPRPARDREARQRDRDEIDRLADDLLPTLIDRLSASGLGELEVREDDWRIRLRRPPLASRSGQSREPQEARDARGPHDRREARELAAARPPTGDGNGTGPAIAAPRRAIATSPAVGVFQPRSEIRVGTRVRAGDRIAAVDLLGVPQDVVAPQDGIVVDTLVAAGEGVEYGQDLLVIELIGRPPPRAGADATPHPPLESQ